MQTSRNTGGRNTSRRGRNSKQQNDSLSNCSSKQSEKISKYFKSTHNIDDDIESPYKNLISEIKINANDSTSDENDFKTPKPIRKFAPPKLSKNDTSKCTGKKGRGRPRIKQTKLTTKPGSSIIDLDVNVDHLQMAMALSRSSYEAENPDGKLEDDPNEIAIMKMATLEKFGFRSNKPLLEVENKRIIETTRKKKTSKFKYITPALLSRTNEDRESLIHSKISLIMAENMDTCRANNEEIKLSLTTKLKQFETEECKFLKLNSLSNEDLNDCVFCVQSLGLSPSHGKCGALLKDWAMIPGRDKSPVGALKKEIPAISESEIMQETRSEDLLTVTSSLSEVQSISRPLNEDKSITSPLSNVQLSHESQIEDQVVATSPFSNVPIIHESRNDDNFTSTTSSLNRSQSPDLFASDDEASLQESLRVVPISPSQSPSLSRNLDSSPPKLNDQVCDLTQSSDEDGDARTSPVPIESPRIKVQRKSLENSTGQSLKKSSSRSRPTNYYNLDLSDDEMPITTGTNNFLFTKISGHQTLDLSNEDLDDEKTNSVGTGTSNSLLTKTSGYQSLDLSTERDDDKTNSFAKKNTSSSSLDCSLNKSVSIDLTDDDDVEIPILNKSHSRMDDNYLTSLKDLCTQNSFKAIEDDDKGNEEESKSPCITRRVSNSPIATGCTQNGIIHFECFSNNITNTPDYYNMNLSDEEPVKENKKIVKNKSFSMDVTVVFESEDSPNNSKRKTFDYNTTSSLNVTDYVTQMLNEDYNNVDTAYENEDLHKPSQDLFNDDLLNYSCNVIKTPNVEIQGEYKKMEVETVSDTDDSQELSQDQINDEELNYSCHLINTPYAERNCSTSSLEEQSTPVTHLPEEKPIRTSLKSRKSLNGEFLDDSFGKLLDKTEVLKAIEVVEQTNNPDTPSNVIVKTDSVTPMLNYDSMDTPKILNELNKYGLKPLKRQRGVKLLKHIYDSMHPVVTGEDDNEEDLPCSKKRRTGDNVQIVAGDKILQNENPDDLIFERKHSTRIPSCRIPLQIVWHNFLANNLEIQENILLYEPLQLEVLHKMLKEQGFKFHIQDLLTFLDKKCITIRTAQGNQNIKR